MKGPTLAVVALLGLALVGLAAYTVHTLTSKVSGGGGVDLFGILSLVSKLFVPAPV